MLAAAWAWFKGSKIAMWAAAAGAALLTVLGILARERAKGREQERAKQDQKALDTVRTVEEAYRQPRLFAEPAPRAVQEAMPL